MSTPNLQAAGDDSKQAPNTNTQENRQIYENFTPYTLPKDSWRIGSQIDYGIADRWSMGTDFFALVVGVINANTKYTLFSGEIHKIALGARFGFVEENTILWGSFRNQFEEVSANIIQPQIVWSQRLSQSFQWHNLFAYGFGDVNLKLTDEAKNKMRQEKKDRSKSEAEFRDSGSTNRESLPSKMMGTFTERTLQISTISSSLSTIAQSTLEYQRPSGNRILLAVKHQYLDISELRSRITSLTMSHHWMGAHIQLRLGLGAQYSQTSGKDFDDEKLDLKEWQPASDINLYWIF